MREEFVKPPFVETASMPGQTLEFPLCVLGGEEFSGSEAQSPRSASYPARRLLTGAAVRLFCVHAFRVGIDCGDFVGRLLLGIVRQGVFTALAREE